MVNKTCVTCIDNDNGLCDRKGILIREDDTRDQHKEDWREKMGKDERLDDGSTDIDSLDAFEYTIERDMKYLIEEVEDV